MLLVGTIVSLIGLVLMVLVDKFWPPAVEKAAALL